jgi:2-aminoadipate transaminase
MVLVTPSPVPLPSLVPSAVAALSTTSAFAVPEAVPDTIHLVRGVPAVEVLPTARIADALRETADSLADDSLRGDLLFGSSGFGTAELCALIAGREVLDESRVMVTNGCMHGVSLALAAFVEPGGIVAVDSPCYPDTLAALELARATPLAIPVDEEGLRVDHLEDRLARGIRPALLYTVPDFQNPTGASLSAERRTRLLELADHYGFVVVADNPYRELGFDGVPVAGFGDSDRLVELSTYSKILGPGLRIGHLTADPALLVHLGEVRRRTDYQASSVVQRMLAVLLRDPALLSEVVARASAEYAGRARALGDALREEAPGRFEFGDPDGGLFTWLRFEHPTATTSDLLEHARQRGVTFSAGSHYAVPGGQPQDAFLRLCFGAADEPRLREGARRLALAVGDLDAAGGAAAGSGTAGGGTAAGSGSATASAAPLASAAR